MRKMRITVVSMIWFWGLTAGLALGLEFATTTLYFGLLAVGATGGLAVSALGAPVAVQVLVTAGITLFGIIAIRPFAIKRFARVPIGAHTGVDALVGSEALTLGGVTLHQGQVKLKGEVWSARLDPDLTSEPIEPNSKVSISRIDGATALVFPLD
jgi:membrane protein implicated in regulation of membrane protease activity